MPFLVLAYAYFLLYLLWAIPFFLLGIKTQDYFGAIISLNYSGAVASQYFWFSMGIFFATVFGYLIGGKLPVRGISLPSLSSGVKAVALLMGYLWIAFFLFNIGLRGSNYWVLAEFRADYRFIFEARILFLVPLILWVCENGPRKRKSVFVFFLFYTSIIVLYQARSVVIEFLMVLILALFYTRTAGFNKLWKKVVALGALLVAPIFFNLFVVVRYWSILGSESFNYVFLFEYLYLFNLIGLEFFERSAHVETPMTVNNSLILLVPSFMREFLEIELQKSPVYQSLSSAAGVHGGGFSLPIEMFLNFGNYVFCLCLLAGVMLGWVYKCSRLSRSPLILILYLFFLVYIMLGLRNDMGVLLKQIVYLFFLSGFLFILPVRRV